MGDLQTEATYPSDSSVLPHYSKFSTFFQTAIN